MRGTSSRAIGIALTSLIAIASTASAQTATPPPNEWDHGTKLSLSSGGAIESPETHPAFGMSIGWEINPRLELEGAGTWLATRRRDDAFTAELKVSGNLTRPRAVMPFLAAGVGMYHASFDTTRGPLPDFYQRRLVEPPVGAIVSFNDPSFVFGGGANFFAGSHVSIRPDVSVRLVTRSSRTFAVTMAMVYFSYHFEKHGTAVNRR